jgi:zinc transporter 9
MAGEGKGAVLFALLGNLFLTVIKFVAFLLSGSGAMLSEAIHSLADTSNQGLLFLGIRRSSRPADRRYHYGYGADRYLFALISAAGIFVLGCGVTVYHGIDSLMDPPTLSLDWLPFAVLGVSLVIEGAVLISAIREVNRKRGDQGFVEFIVTSTDPTLLAVLFEDSVAVLGVLVAAAGIGLAHLTGNGQWDAISSIVIGLLLGAVALWLAWRNRQLILGPAIPEKIQKRVVAHIETQPSVDTVRLVKTRIVGADRFRIDAEIDYNGRYLGAEQADWVRDHAELAARDPARFAADFGERLLDELGREVDRIEASLFEKFPRLRHVALESDWNPDDHPEDES